MRYSKKRVLAVAHAFAPAAPIGTMRTLRLVRRLAQEGWDVKVLTAAPRTYAPDTPLDPALLARIPSGVTVAHAPVIRIAPLLEWFRAPRRHSVGNPASLPVRPPAPRSLLRRIHAVLNEVTAIPDKESGWIIPAVTIGLWHIARERPHVLYSSSPPWTGQIVALVLARLTGLPWVADFRDPWARAPLRETQPARIRRASVVLERWTVKRADQILFATHTNRDEYTRHYGKETAAKFHVVLNGCDGEEFSSLPSRRTRGQFVMLHAGSLYGARSPEPLLQSIAVAIESGTIDRERFRLRFIGTSTHNDFPGSAAALGLSDMVEFAPRKPRQEILTEMASASCLLALQPGTTMSIPGKVYEYLAIGRPILALTEEGELADLMRRSGIGVAAGPDDIVGIGHAIRQVMAMDRLDSLPAPDPLLFDGNASAGQAVQIMDSLVCGRRAERAGTTTVHPARRGPMESDR